MLLEEYISYIRKNFDPEEIDIRVSTLNVHDEQPFLSLNITFDDEDVSPEKILLDLIQFKEIKLQDTVFSDIALLDEHPLLWKYNDFQSSLFFSKATGDQYKLFWELYRAHRGVYEELLPLDTYLNIALLDRSSFLPSFGLFANGPQKLMNIYAECLEGEGVSCSQTNISPPTLWDGSRYTKGFQRPKILFLNKSFIIAEDFILRERIPMDFKG
ncbi:hypothetical protein HHL17_23240 [Chitinophaga sp. G-6-1-13]|uniref:Uncharacterized protein n=1 Tax=Chitinophaga fulva TaxID=2728842 RepID=A0A848GTS2_9BACT|nr:hypothetical protein [Chitinophaga fulva]NML40133.1 hypothetical protein [Chitinophaga fulva]